MIKDFGEKIGGARKDLWKTDGLTIDDLEHLNSAERAAYTTKDYVWPIPSGQQQVAGGTEVFVAFWQRKVRSMVRKAPVFYSYEDKMTVIKDYITAVRDLKLRVMACQTMKDLTAFETESMKNDYDYKYWDRILSVKNLRSLRYCKTELRRKMLSSNFPNKKTRKSARRMKFIPPKLSAIERTGIDYRHGFHISPSRWQKDFNFRGVEFGNWCSQNVRQMSMDYCYDALKDLACVLQIEDRNIAFDGQLALAFGARGHSGASAHYEPFRKVINLTKMNGAGCTAHEWMHALDHQLAMKYCGEDSSELASEIQDKRNLPKSFVRLTEALCKDADGNYTDFYRGSNSFDRYFSKDHFGYWSSTSEMLARAFACYVKDTLNEKSDYLIAHADCYVFEYDCQSICAIPQGEEREIFNELFDQLFFELKRLGFFQQRENTVVMPQTKILEKGLKNLILDYEEDMDGQLLLSI